MYSYKESYSKENDIVLLSTNGGAMPALCMGFGVQKKTCWTSTFQGIAYFIQLYLVKVIQLQDILNMCEVTAFYSSKQVKGILWSISRKSLLMEEKSRFQSKKNSTIKHHN